MKHYCAKPSAHCTNFASRPEHMEQVLLQLVLCILVYIYRNLCSMHVVTTRMCITRYYVIATDHVYAESAELVPTKSQEALIAEFSQFSDKSVEL